MEFRIVAGCFLSLEVPIGVPDKYKPLEWFLIWHRVYL